jgi:hypothetical protein
LCRRAEKSIEAIVVAGSVCLLYLLGISFWPHLIEAVLGTIDPRA